MRVIDIKTGKETLLDNETNLEFKNSKFILQSDQENVIVNANILFKGAEVEFDLKDTKLIIKDGSLRFDNCKLSGSIEKVSTSSKHKSIKLIFMKSKFNKVNIRNSYFKWAKFSSCDFEGCMARNFKIGYSEISSLNFEDCIMPEKTAFVKCNILALGFRKCKLDKLFFNKCNIQEDYILKRIAFSAIKQFQISDEVPQIFIKEDKRRNNILKSNETTVGKYIIVKEV